MLAALPTRQGPLLPRVQQDKTLDGHDHAVDQFPGRIDEDDAEGSRPFQEFPSVHDGAPSFSVLKILRTRISREASYHIFTFPYISKFR